MAAEVAVTATKHDPRAGKHAVYTVGVRDLLYRDAHLSLTIAATVLTGSAYVMGWVGHRQRLAQRKVAASSRDSD